LNPYPVRYRPAFACSDILIPARPSAHPCGRLSSVLVGTVGLTTFHTRTAPEGVRPHLYAGSTTSARRDHSTPRPGCVPFWSMPASLFGMLSVTTPQQWFTYVGRTLQPELPTAMRLAVATSPRGSVALLSGGGHSVPDASHPGVTPNARPGRVPAAEHRIFMFPDKYACDFVSHEWP
jgi:hypothetical protein